MRIIPVRAKTLLKLVVFPCCIFLTASCSSFDLIPSDSLIQRLKGRGPVLVSADNPYIAANLLLEQESKHSQELKGFLETKGMPSALSVTQDFLQPARLKLYYGNRSEQFDLELLQGLWVIKGPTIIKDQIAKDLIYASALNDINTVPLKNVPRKSMPLKPSSQEATQDLVPLFDRNVITEESTATEKKPTIEPSKEIEVTQGEEISPIEALISKYASSPAETTPKGDIVHFVTSEQETLSLIAKWYTKSELTISRISRANKLAPSAILRPGDQLVIPAELVKNKLRLPEEAIPELAGETPRARRGWSLDFNN